MFNNDDIELQFITQGTLPVDNNHRSEYESGSITPTLIDGYFQTYKTDHAETKNDGDEDRNTCVRFLNDHYTAAKKTTAEEQSVHDTNIKDIKAQMHEIITIIDAKNCTEKSATQEELITKLKHTLTSMSQRISQHQYIESFKEIDAWFKETTFVQNYETNITRYGIRHDKFSFLIEKSTFGLLSPVEFSLAYDALKNLRDEKPVALLDIFARSDPDKKIKTNAPKNTFPEVHTVVLLHIDDRNAVLIDPNDSKFSAFIADTSNRVSNKTIHVYNEKDHTYFPNTSSTFYSIKSAIHQRDCIDVAVKIASFLNEHYKECNSNELINLLYDRMSNDRKNDTLALLKGTKEAYSSKADEREKIYSMLEFLTTNGLAVNNLAVSKKK